MKIAYLLFFLTLIGIFSSCNKYPNNTKIENTLESGKLSFSINMSNAPSEVSYLLGILTKDGQDTIDVDFKIENGYATAIVEGLIAGNWSLQVDAFNSQDLVIYTGSTELTVFAGQTTPVKLQLHPATGSIEIIVTWGEEKSALYFDGIDDMAIVYEPDSMFTKLHSEITMEGWIYMRSYPNIAPRIIDRSDNHHAAPYGDRFLLALWEPQHSVHININGYSVVSDSVGLNQWIHVAGTYDGMVLRIYVNGELKNSKYIETIIDVKESSLYVGNNELNTRQFDGMISSLRIWNKALSKEYIQHIKENGAEGITDYLISNWNFDQGEGQIVIDSYGSNDLQLGTTIGEDENDPKWMFIE